MGKLLDGTIGARNPVAMAWQANDFAIVANGQHPGAGHQRRAANRPGQVDDRWRPYFAAGGTNGCEALSQVAYYPRRLSNAVLQTLTAA